MKVTVAIDSFKGSLTTIEAGESAKAGILAACPDAEVFVRPMADGGEGTAFALAAAMGGEMVQVNVHGPLGDKVTAQYGMAGRTAVMEMAQASGITLIPREKLVPMRTSTVGVGEMILDAISRGCREFIIGIGGSATNDGGMGMLTALGVRFLDGSGRELAPCGGALGQVKTVDTSGISSLLGECNFRIACDVKNPLCGDNGCSAVFGPQKGLAKENIPLMDGWLAGYAEAVKQVNPLADPDAPGAGAAGGLGFAFVSFMNAALIPGIDLVIEVTGLEEYIKSSDLVITGEGRLDSQSCMGKAPMGVSRLAKKYGKVCVALSGCVADDAGANNRSGIDAFFPILKAPCSLSDAMDKGNAGRNLADTAQQVMRLFLAARGCF